MTLLKTILNKIKNMEIERIENENGTAIKFSDGSMLQYGTLNNNSTGSPTIDFPIDFINNNYNVQLTNRYSSGGGAVATQIVLTAHYAGTGACLVYFRDLSGSAVTNTDVMVNWQAIGRWK